MASFLGQNNVDSERDSWHLAAKAQARYEDSQCVHVGFVMGKVTMGQMFSQYLALSSTVFIPPVLHIHSPVTDVTQAIKLPVAVDTRARAVVMTVRVTK